MKAYIAAQIEEGKTYTEILNEVKREMISQMLVKSRGNQTLAAEMFGANRGTIRKYAKVVKKCES